MLLHSETIQKESMNTYKKEKQDVHKTHSEVLQHNI
jgi:hypothetical protein